MRTTASILGLTLLLTTAPAVAVELPEPVYRVELQARFDPATRTITGRERLHWRNTSSVEVSELWFHLYLNAFANNRSTFIRESGGQLRGVRIPAGGWGFVEVEKARLATGEELAGRFAQPDDGNPDDRTVVVYPLPRPVPPGGDVELELEFTSRLPRVFARTGVHGDFVLGGQWFPKIAVLEDVGVRGRETAGWSAGQFHANSEFYADFGDWVVELTLPARYAGRVGGTGVLIEERAEGDDVVVRFAARGVHDFAWTADPRYVVVRERFDPERDVPAARRTEIAGLLGVSEEVLSLTPVEIVLLVQPGHRAQADRLLGAARATLAEIGLLLGRYPYPVLTLVDPPRGALGSGGMEYPTLITLGSHPLLALPALSGLRWPEMVTVHELIHNYFQGMVASNEVEEAWLDEGLTSYYEMVVMERTYPHVLRLGRFGLGAEDSARARLGGGGWSDPIVQASWRYRSSGSYSQASYTRPAVLLRHLERVLGAETFHRAMRSYFESFRFRHPTTADLERILVAAAPSDDVASFIAAALHTSASLDLGVASASSRPLPGRRGFFPGEDGELDEKHQAGRFRTLVVLERRGELRHPAEVELEWSDGTLERRTWDGKARWARWEIERDARLLRAEIDPDGVLVYDVNRLNNGILLEVDRRPAASFAARLLGLVQAAFALTGVLG